MLTLNTPSSSAPISRVAPSRPGRPFLSEAGISPGPTSTGARSSAPDLRAARLFFLFASTKHFARWGRLTPAHRWTGAEFQGLRTQAGGPCGSTVKAPLRRGSIGHNAINAARSPQSPGSNLAGLNSSGFTPGRIAILKSIPRLLFFCFFPGAAAASSGAVIVLGRNGTTTVNSEIGERGKSHDILLYVGGRALAAMLARRCRRRRQLRDDCGTQIVTAAAREFCRARWRSDANQETLFTSAQNEGLLGPLLRTRRLVGSRQLEQTGSGFSANRSRARRGHLVSKLRPHGSALLVRASENTIPPRLAGGDGSGQKLPKNRRWPPPRDPARRRGATEQLEREQACRNHPGEIQELRPRNIRGVCGHEAHGPNAS